MTDLPGNPTDTPRQDNLELGSLDMGFDAPRLTQRDGTFNAACELFFANLGSITQILLLTYLPASLLVNILTHLARGDDGAIGLLWVAVAILIDAVTKPAIVYLLIIHIRDGRRASVGECLAWGRRHWLRMAGYGLLTTLVIGLGVLCFIVPGILFAVWWVFWAIIISAEGQRAESVLERSKKLTEGHRWEIFWLGVGITVVLGLLSTVLGVVDGVTENPLAITATDFVATIAEQFYVVAFLILYLRIQEKRRHECRTCGYNLTGNVSGFCPECGARVPEGFAG